MTLFCWLMNSVDEVILVDDGELVRTVVVRTADGKTFSRDRTKVVRLELDLERVSDA